MNRLTFVEFDPSVYLDLPGQRVVGIERKFEVFEDVLRILIEKTIGSKHRQRQNFNSLLLLSALLAVLTLLETRIELAVLANIESLLQPELALRLQKLFLSARCLWFRFNLILGGSERALELARLQSGV